MKNLTALKMEVRRQSGRNTVVTIPVGQGAHEADGVRASFEEHREDGLRVISLHLQLLQKEHWIFDGLAQSAPVRIYLPFDPKPLKMTALYMFCDWWTRPAFVDRFEDIPPRTQVLLMKNEDTCACLIPMVGQDWKATAHGGTETELCLEVSCGVAGYVSVDEPVFIYAEGNTVSEAVHTAFTWIARAKGIPMRTERRLPDIFKSLGWCSWNAFYTDVDEAGLRAKAAEFAEKSVPARWMIIDDGWMSTQGTCLTGFAPDSKKFPNGFSQMINDIRQSSPIQKFGVWHALGGYWNGVATDSPLAAAEKDHLLPCVNGQLVPSPDNGADFYRNWYRLLRRQGIEFVKVDGQSTAARYFDSTRPISSAVRGMNEALEMGASLLDNTIINCMGMAMENVLARPSSAVSRNSDDFFPDREGSFVEHILENAYNALYHDEICVCDWDMFWTSHKNSGEHALLRAISGGPVYFSDRVGETDPEVLRPLAYLDGKLPMMVRSARPTEDCIFSDPREGGVLKLHNAAPWGDSMAGGIAVFNLTEKPQTFSFTPSDVPELAAADRCWVYDYFKKTACSVERDARFEGEMPAQGYGWYVILPENETISCLGLADKYVGFTAVESLAEAPGSTTAVLHETGPIAWLSRRECQSAELNGEDVTGKVVRDGCLYTLPLEEKSGKAVLRIRW